MKLKVDYVLIGAIVAAIALIFIADARAASVSGGTRNYQQWIDNAPVEAPDADITVIENSSRCSEDGTPVSGCTYQGSTEIYLEVHPGYTKDTFFHELGHQFDYWSLSDQQRAKILAIIGREFWINRTLEHDSAHEIFADAYRQCALGLRDGRYSEKPVVIKKRLVKICNTVRSQP